jgi:4-hydroxy-tetrahydrodipicolinate synthase
MSMFRGIIPPICTPLDEERRVDVRSLEALVEHHLRAGVHGLFALGSTGEAIYLTDADRRVVLDVVVGTVAGSVPVFAGALDASTARTVDQVRWVSHYRIDALVVTAPFYANVSPAEIVTHFTTVAAAAHAPVLAYDIPGNVGKKLAAATSVELLASGVLGGLKDSSGNMDDFLKILAALPEQPARTSSIFTGSDARALEYLDAGADGIVPGIGNICAQWFVELWNAHRAGDRDGAQRAQQLITAMTEVFPIGEHHGLGRHASELGGLKTVLAHDGLTSSSQVSLPLSRMPAVAAAEVLDLIGRMRP